jgi:hypothetical protein
MSAPAGVGPSIVRATPQLTVRSWPNTVSCKRHGLHESHTVAIGSARSVAVNQFSVTRTFVLPAGGKTSAGDGYGITIRVLGIRKAVAIRPMGRTELKSFPGTFLFERFYVFNVKNQLDRCLARLHTLSCLVHHDDATAMQRSQFRYSPVRIEFSGESEVLLVERASPLHVFRIQQYPVQKDSDLAASLECAKQIVFRIR